MTLSFGVKVLLVVICALVSVIVGMIAALLLSSSGKPHAEAVLYGGGAFAGCMTLCLLVLSTLKIL